MVTAIITIVGIIAGLTFVAMANTWWAGKVRRKYLRAEYGADPALTQRLIDKEIWAGMSKRQMVDSIGDPADKDMQDKGGISYETYKYDKVGDKYRRRVHLQNGVVVNWEQDQ